MISPKILASGTFTPENLKVSVAPSNRKVDAGVEAQLEKAWLASLEKARAEGRIIYNGTSYRLNSLKQESDNLILEFGTFEYKVRDGLIAIPGYFDLPEPYYRKGCYTAASVRTADDEYLMAELSGKSMNMNTLETLGGIMETQPQVHAGEDVFESLYKELEEEALITRQDIAECYLRAVFLERKTNVCFYFEVRLAISSQDILGRLDGGGLDEEIKSVKVFTKKEYISILQTLNENKQLIAKLLA